MTISYAPETLRNHSVHFRHIYYNYSKRHNKFLLPALVEAIYGDFYKAEYEISNVVNYK